MSKPPNNIESKEYARREVSISTLGDRYLSLRTSQDSGLMHKILILNFSRVQQKIAFRGFFRILGNCMLFARSYSCDKRNEMKTVPHFTAKL
jgi:hypothetical protein